MIINGLEALSLKILGHRCREETARFWEKLSYSGLYCLELFRRALSQTQKASGQKAWAYIHQQYHPQVTRWVKQHRLSGQTNFEAEALADLALEKMWVSFTLSPDKLAKFPLNQPDKCLATLLKFLKTCVHSVVLDALEPPGEALEEDVIAQNDVDVPLAEAFWQAINQRLKNDKERLILDALYVYGYKPAQIYQIYPDTFHDVKEIYRIKENVLARLKRDQSLKLYQDI